MFSRGKAEKPKRDRSNRNLAQYGLFDVHMDGDIAAHADGNDSDLEAELLALSSGGGAKPKRPRQKVAPAVNLDAMVAESMRDTPSDAELSGDDDDPDLLNELSEITGVEAEPEPEPEIPQSRESPTDISKLLEERLKMYEVAEKNAKDSGESGRARRFSRGIKTLKDLIKQANAGRSINDDDIPPVVTVNVQKHNEGDEAPASDVPSPSRPAPEIPSPTISSPEVPSSPVVSPENAELLQLLSARKDEYKMAALQAKKSGDSQTAISFIKIAKQFEAVIKAVESGQPVDLSKMPGPPSQQQVAPIEQSEAQTGSTSPEEPSESIEGLPEPALITASSVAEALQQRLEVYQKQEAKAKEEGNASKARRMGRIVKQFQDAIKSNNAGKPIAVEDLPTPPGYAPIPVPGAKAPTAVPAATPDSSVNNIGAVPVQPRPSPPPKPQQLPQPGKSNSARSRIDKQVALLMERQKEFKDAALAAKRKGELTQAKEFLRTAKGFDKLIGAAQGGLPVDISSLPLPPSAKSELDEGYDLLIADEAEELDPEHLDMLSRLEQQLTKQLKLCLSTRDHNKAIGDVASMNRFEQLALSVTKDLDIIRLAKRSASGKVPKFHYETKDFSIVKSCTDLNDNDLELTIIRGVNYSCSNPKDVDTYVKFEFPYPQEEPVRNKTAVIKNTNNPDYNETFVVPIQRTARQCLRVFKRHGVKCEVFSRGGLFRSDTLLGTVSIKLQPLETQCELHESFDLMEGRKKVGGKLEVRMRVRDPMVTRQVEQLSEKWLMIDH